MSENRTVYSTETGRICPQCGQPVANCTCKQNASRPRGDGIVRVRLETKGRRGKAVTTISGLPLDEEGLQNLTTDLKRQCGAGGAVKDWVIEIQGDHCSTLLAALKKLGYTVKRA